MNGPSKRVATIVACLGLSVAMAQTPPASVPASVIGAPDTTAPAMTEADVGVFFDALMPFALRRSDIAGGVVVVVKGRQVLFAKGYGYADLAKRTPVSPDDTLFRPGSTSKLFTWTAVMQLVEQGKLQLDRDINDYLDFRIPPRDGRVITLQDLLTHTPGFEDSARDLLPASVDEVNLERYLKDHIPARIFPAGEFVAYSNYGCGLAGYIVQRISGERYEDYIAQHIFQPLGMKHSTFAQPLPASLAPLMSKAYKMASDGKPQPFEAVDPAPAGAMSTTAQDMARFMIAQLQSGRYGDASILKPETIAAMHEQHYAPGPGIAGFGLGFYREDRNGLRIAGHGGDTVLFHSDLHLLLDKDVGIFMSFNSAGSADAGGVRMVRAAIFHDFLDRYFPASLPDQETLPNFAADASRVVGWYEMTRRNDSALRLFSLLSQFHVAAEPDGTLTVSPMIGDDAGKPLHWHEIAPLQYREVNGRARLDFVTNPDGSIRYWTTDYIPAITVFQRVSGSHSMGSVGPLAGLSIAILLVTLLVWMVGPWVRRHYRAMLDPALAARRYRLLSRLGTLALFVTIAGWFVLVAAIGANEKLLLQGLAAPWMILLYVLGAVALFGVVAIVAHAFHMVSRPIHGRWVRIGETILAFAALYLGWFILAFGLVSFNTHF
ncbi:CubicO group peptidase (beta-lactamase class C family) [Luteibacter rhizovicinus]|uniref:CubicO group peptidase (Beta-lactamase class C family) n=1 Tax=Luteibacter rhizovicinus TaxID=242606 RepID=A0A4R3YYR9_9GAMM|nr:serine hydrolase [Luteibacter rhizovicinus]TCV97776.1 CubicO group peptidase (beta-lactamase class C family) [Luteibacter rhizovicinus]